MQKANSPQYSIEQITKISYFESARKKQIRHNILLNKLCPQEEHSSDFATIAIEHMVAKFQ